MIECYALAGRSCVAVYAALMILMVVAGGRAAVDSYYEMCDASAAIAVDDSHFIVANDEDNILRIYNVNKAQPVRAFDLSGFLKIAYDDKSPESDIEGAARIGEYYFFITSHGRDKKGRLRRNRHRFFAVKIDDRLNVMPVGAPYRGLLDNLARTRAMQKLSLYDAYLPNDKKREKLAPKKNGVNIEGLAAIPGTEKLIIGFRNPIPHGKAILVVLENPLPVVLHGADPEFGQTALLDLGERGIRDIVFHAKLQKYVIIGGAPDGKKRSRLFLWSGFEQEQPRVAANVNFKQQKDFNPEALIVYDDHSAVQVLSDDGTLRLDDGAGGVCVCKELQDARLKKYRSLWIENSALVPEK